MESLLKGSKQRSSRQHILQRFSSILGNSSNEYEKLEKYSKNGEMGVAYSQKGDRDRSPSGLQHGAFVFHSIYTSQIRSPEYRIKFSLKQRKEYFSDLSLRLSPFQKKKLKLSDRYSIEYFQKIEKKTSSMYRILPGKQKSLISSSSAEASEQKIYLKRSSINSEMGENMNGLSHSESSTSI